MIHRILVTAVLISLAMGYDFSQFVIQYNKTYNADQYRFREQLFIANYTKIQEVNSQNLGYTLSVNQMTDWTYAEVQAYLGGRINSTPSRTAFPKEDIAVSSLSTNGFDWRDRGIVSPVKNQGSCGSCWAFGTTSVFQSYVALKTGNVYDLSEQFILECTPGSGCNGGYTLDALNRHAAYGIPTETDYPYTASNAGSVTPSTAGICSARNRVSAEPPRVTEYTYSSIMELRTIVERSPLSIGFVVEDSFAFFSSGVYSCSRTVQYSEINHIMMLVGYTSNGDWIVKNSWGTNWGNDGYGIITYNIYYDCGIRYFSVQLAAQYIVAVTILLLLTL